MTTIRYQAKFLTAVFGVLSAVSIALLIGLGEPAAQTASSQSTSCYGTYIRPGNDLDAIVNADTAAKATTFCVQPGTYYVDNTVRLENNDKLIGRRGTLKWRGPALDPNPTVKIVNAGGLTRIFSATGNVRMEWLKIQGSLSGARYTNDTRATCPNWGEASNRCPELGTGTAIAGKSGPNSLFRYLEIYNNASNCITSIRGRLYGSELYRCSRNADYWGYTAGALKTIYETEAARNFVHDNAAVGLWCDQGCRNTASRGRGFWVHHNLVVNNGRSGVRYEFAPMPGEPAMSSALVERNRLAGNNWGGADMADARNATFRYNVFGPQTVGGVKYWRNGTGRSAGLRSLGFEDSGRASRTALYNGDAYGNDMNGETIGNCQKPDAVVHCRNNR